MVPARNETIMRGGTMLSMNIFEHLLIEKIDFLRRSFLETSREVFFNEDGKLIHPGEFGQYREGACKDFIRFITPNRLSIGQGFLINTSGKVSHQCDIVIYDSDSSPLIESNERQRFYPIETTVAVGEVKSILSKSDFREAINKLSKVKVLREEIKHPVVIRKEHSGAYDPVRNPYDQVFTFLICQKLDFDLSDIVGNINLLYDSSIICRHKHNLILSIEDGLLAYYDENGKTMMYPFMSKPLKNRFVQPDANIYTHFKLYSSYLFLGTSSGTILYPEVTDYMGDVTGGYIFNEK